MSTEVDMQPNLLKDRVKVAAQQTFDSRYTLFPITGDGVAAALTLVDDGGWTTEPVTTGRSTFESDLIDASAAVRASVVAQDAVCSDAHHGEDDEVDANHADHGWKTSTAEIDMKVTSRSYAGRYTGDLSDPYADGYVGSHSGSFPSGS